MAATCGDSSLRDRVAMGLVSRLRAAADAAAAYPSTTPPRPPRPHLWRARDLLPPGSAYPAALSVATARCARISTAGQGEIHDADRRCRCPASTSAASMFAAAAAAAAGAAAETAAATSCCSLPPWTRSAHSCRWQSSQGGGKWPARGGVCSVTATGARCTVCRCDCGCCRRCRGGDRRCWRCRCHGRHVVERPPPPAPPTATRAMIIVRGCHAAAGVDGLSDAVRALCATVTCSAGHFFLWWAAVKGGVAWHSTTRGGGPPHPSRPPLPLPPSLSHLRWALLQLGPPQLSPLRAPLAAIPDGYLFPPPPPPARCRPPRFLVCVCRGRVGAGRHGGACCSRLRRYCRR